MHQNLDNQFDYVTVFLHPILQWIKATQNTASTNFVLRTFHALSNVVTERCVLIIAKKALEIISLVDINY